MTKVNVTEVKTHLSRYLDRVEAAETVILYRRNRPVAELRPIPAERKRERIFGIDQGKFTLGPEFFEPLPEDILRAFKGDEP